jgi:hypothetical protein
MVAEVTWTPVTRLGSITGNLLEVTRDIDQLANDQNVPLVEKIRLLRLVSEIAVARYELVEMERRAGKPGWEVIGQQEGPEHGDAIASSREGSASKSFPECASERTE